MAKTKAHAKRNDTSISKGECVKTLTYYALHYQDDIIEDTGKLHNHNQNSPSETQVEMAHDAASAQPQDFGIMDKECAHLTMHNQTQTYDEVACNDLPNWRASCSFHQPTNRLPHHVHDIPLYEESYIQPKPPVVVYYRKRKKKLLSDCAAPPTPHPHATPHTSNRRSGKVDKKKSSVSPRGKSKQKIQTVSREYKAGHMVLRTTVSRVKRNKAGTTRKYITSKASDPTPSSISLRNVSKKNKCQSKEECVRASSTSTREATKFKRTETHGKLLQFNTDSLSSRKRRKASRLSAILSRMNTSKALAQERDDETCHKASGEDEEERTNLSTPLAKPKRKKHRPKVQTERLKASPKAPQAARGAPRSTKARVRSHKKVGKNPLRKRGRPPKGSQTANHNREEKKAKHVSKKRRTSPSHIQNLIGSTGFCVVNGCPEMFNVFPCTFHKDNTKSLLPSLQGTKDALIVTHGKILCLHDPLTATDTPPPHVHPAAEASSSASNELSQVGGSNAQLALAQEHCPSTITNNSGQLVLYDQRREIVLFKVPKQFKKVRAKVPIGAENERIWPLLALGGVPTDFEDPQYWEKERNLMRKRVLNFIWRMHEVQGDRRFSPWKGSVLDSVVGAFLTQNVSDHLSSSAFMSIASRFPPARKEYRSHAATSEAPFPAETETNATSSPNEMGTSSATDNLVHIAGLYRSSKLGYESPYKSGDRTPIEGSIQDAYVQPEVKGTEKVCTGHFQKGAAKNNSPDITKQGSTQKNDSKATATSTYTRKGTSPSQSKRIHKSKLKPQSTPHATLNNLKKRKLSHISGIERAHIEENLNGRKKSNSQDWESMRKQTLKNPSRDDRREAIHEDSVDWEAVRHSKVEDLAKAIKERGMHHVLSGRIKAFLKTLDEEHGSIDLEWLRKLSPKDARAYLMSIHGLNVKSTECIRLLTLHHVAFPVDVNVGRVCVRLGWVPIEPLPEQLQLHLLELYPLQETIQKYLWPRLATLDQKTLYEFHYQLITFGKIFCTKSRPNCNACPMQKECKHFASAYASAKLLLTGPLVHPLSTNYEATAGNDHASDGFATKPLISEIDSTANFFCYEEEHFVKSHPFSIEVPATPEDEETHEEEIMDLEDFPYIYKDSRDFTEELLTSANFSESLASLDRQIDCVYTNVDGVEDPRSSCPPSCSYGGGEGCTQKAPSELRSNKAAPTTTKQNTMFEEATTSAIVSYPMGQQHPQLPQLKKVSPLRTVHYVYEIPDMHPLLEKVEPRRKDDPSSYLLVIWSPGEIPESKQDIEELCNSCPSHGNPSETVSGTLLIPCRTALQGSFPLNGTYFQVNEVFADHESSLTPFQVPRALIWGLHRRFVYFGTSVTQIFRGFTTSEIKGCFSNGYICVRGFDRVSRAPKPLVCRLHLSKSREQNKRSTKVEK